MKKSTTLTKQDIVKYQKLVADIGSNKIEGAIIILPLVTTKKGQHTKDAVVFSSGLSKMSLLDIILRGLKMPTEDILRVVFSE